MPKAEQFPEYMQRYASETLFNVGENVAEMARMAAEYMSDYIKGGSPTGTEWHANKNYLNSFEYGARIGNRNPEFSIYGVDKHSGLMLKSVGTKPVQNTRNKISVRFGWVKEKKDYFAQQDTGSYAPNGVGMGLINEGDQVLQKYGAVIYAENVLMKIMRKDGFKVKLEGGDLWA